VDFPLLVAHRDELLAFEHVAPRVREHLGQRLELAQVPFEELWDRLLRHARNKDEDAEIPREGDASRELVEAVARHGAAAAGSAMERLREGLRDDWMEVFCVQVLGELRHAPAIDLLIDRLAIDDDVMPGQAVEVLTRIGTPDVVRRLEAYYPGKPWHVRLYADDPIARIKRPESEAALLRLLEIETEPDLVATLAAGLCELCTTEGLEAVRRVIVEGRYDPQMEDLEELLLTVGAMVCYEAPEAAGWREQIARREAERERRLAEMTSGRQRGFGAEPAASRDWSSDWRSGPAHGPPPGTFQRESPKVGRNDPCPCGSGKKYKKCCLKGSEFAV
jgi:hypothetical protein